MTRHETSLPSPPAEKMEPPGHYDEYGNAFSEKTMSAQSSLNDMGSFTDNPASPSTPCPKHNPSQTSSLDAHLHTSAAREAAQSLSATITTAVDGEHCTRCTANEAARTLTRYLFEMRQAKKAKNWSREDKKAMKVESKGLMKEVKNVVKEEKARLKREARG